MARFDFTLQAVLDQREADERACQMELGRARLALAQLDAQLERLHAEVGEANGLMRDEHLVGRLDVGVLAAHRRYLIATSAAASTLATQIATARMEVEARQRKLLDAAKGRKAIESLRDKQKSRWLADQSRKELAIADDVGMQIAYQNLIAGGGIG